MGVDELANEIIEKAHLEVDPNTAGLDQIMLIEGSDTLTTIMTTAYSFIVILLIVTIPLIVLMEILYISFPLIRSGMDFAIKKAAEGKIVRRAVEFTFRDARLAVVQAETVQTGKSAMAIYLGIKLKSVTFIMFMVALVLLGCKPIVNFVLQLFSGLITTLIDSVNSMLTA